MFQVRVFCKLCLLGTNFSIGNVKKLTSLMINESTSFGSLSSSLSDDCSKEIQGQRPKRLLMAEAAIYLTG